MIDLHTHTNESDGSFSPHELIGAALVTPLEAIAITDHDTFAGWEQARPLAVGTGLEVVCGIEITTRAHGRTVHMLAYFLDQPPSEQFREWLQNLQAARRDRNRRLIERLNQLGVDLHLTEVETLGRSLTGRPHFARVLVQKGYALTHQEAFEKYLGETAPGFVERDSPDFLEAAKAVTRGGGIPVLAHPIRLGIRDHALEERTIAGLVDEGLRGLEVFHSDQSTADSKRYQSLADKLGLAVTGGSDFHGTNKPDISLGTGRNRNLCIGRELLDKLRAL